MNLTMGILMLLLGAACAFLLWMLIGPAAWIGFAVLVIWSSGKIILDARERSSRRTLANRR